MAFQPDIYKMAAKLNQLAIFEWDTVEDVLEYDEMLPRVLRRELPRGNFSAFMKEARLVHPKDRVNFLRETGWLMAERCRCQAPQQEFSLDFRFYVEGRSYIWISMNCQVFVDGGRARRVIGVLQNVSKEHIEQARMKEIMERDPMTGLYSKTHSATLAAEAIALSGSRHALLVIDMDNFKQVNDKLGHLIGDAVILDMAMNLKVLFRNTDILGHIGGDEFMVLMKNIPSLDIVHDRAGKLRDSLRRSYVHNDETVKVSASIGIAISPAHGTDYETLFAHADAALYHGKRSGKDSHVIYEEGFTAKGEQEKQKDWDVADGTANDYHELLTAPKRYIMRKVMESKDTMLALEILMGVFAKQFGVHRAYVFWHIDGPYWPRALFDYVQGDYKSAARSHDVGIRRQMKKRYHQTEWGLFTICNDVSRLSQMAQKEMAKGHIKAYIECAIMDGKTSLGSVGFDDCEQAHVWSDHEKAVLQALAQVMQRFLFGQIYFERIIKHRRLEL